jgi:tetratricopeptide (TPR) repeat protein
VTFDDPAAQRAARRSGALAGIGVLWVALLASLGLLWLALGTVVATVTGIVALVAVAWRPHFGLRARRRAVGRRIRAADESVGRVLMSTGAGARVSARRSFGWSRRAIARADESIGRVLMSAGAHARVSARRSLGWSRRAAARAGAGVKSASSATASAAVAGTKAVSSATASGTSTAWERTRSQPLPRPESPLPALREATTSAVTRARAIELPKKRRPPRVAGHKLAHESVVSRREGRVDEAVVLAREAVEAFREADDRRGEALALNTLALALAQEQRFAEAVDALDGAITLLGEIGDRHREGTVLVNLGTLHRQAGGVESARFCWRKALERLDPASPESHETERLLRAS